jgi:hypothetical protein
METNFSANYFQRLRCDRPCTSSGTTNGEFICRRDASFEMDLPSTPLFSGGDAPTREPCWLQQVNELHFASKKIYAFAHLVPERAPSSASGENIVSINHIGEYYCCQCPAFHRDCWCVPVSPLKPPRLFQSRTPFKTTSCAYAPLKRKKRSPSLNKHSPQHETCPKYSTSTSRASMNYHRTDFSSSPTPSPSPSPIPRNHVESSLLL